MKDVDWETKTLMSMSPSSVSSSTSSSPWRTRCPRLFDYLSRHWSAVSTLGALTVSAVPYITFLLVYCSNELIRVLPTSKSGQSPCVTLHNVTAWESVFLPFSVNRIVASFSSTPLDLLSALPYLGHYILPIVYPVGLVAIAGRVDCAQRFFRLVGWTMWVHYVIWYVLPTAPPWFYDSQPTGFGVTPTTTVLLDGGSPAPAQSAAAAPSSTALVVPVHREGATFARIDALTGYGFFYGLFAGNPVPFAAFPSGHVAWPTCVVLTLPTNVRRWPAVVYVCVVAWATMYSCHHYLSDVLAALVVVLVVDKVLNRVSQGRLGLVLPVVRPNKVAAAAVPVHAVNGFHHV